MKSLEKISKNLLSKFLPIPLSLGIDAGESSIKITLVKRKSNNSASLLAWKVIDLSEDRDKEKEAFVSAVNMIVKEFNLPVGTQAKLLISGPQTDSKRVVLPPMPKDDIAQALRLQAKEHFLLNVDESRLDFEILQESATTDPAHQIEVMASIGQADLINHKISLLDDTHVTPSVVTLSAYGLFNAYALGRQDLPDEPIALVDIGYAATNLIVIKKEKIKFIRQIGCGDRDFTSAMTGTFIAGQDKMGISSEEAEKIKREVGLPQQESSEQVHGVISAGQIISMLRPVVERMSSEIKRSFDFYSVQYGEGQVSKMILTGGGSKIRNLDKDLSKRLAVPVSLLDTPPGLKIKIRSNDEGPGPMDFSLLAGAVGACLSDISGVNLIPVSYKARKMKRLEIASARYIFIFIFILLIASYIFNVAQKKALVNLLSARKPEWHQLVEIQNLYTLTSQKNSIVNKTLKQQIPVYVLFKKLSNIIPKNAKFDRLTISNEVSHIQIRGLVYGSSEAAGQALADFIKAVEEAPFFQRVHLISSQHAKSSGKEALRFEIKANLGNR
ncbi:pilus assembly protein PilM [Candidatus Omnitrophota bacterium]